MSMKKKVLMLASVASMIDQFNMQNIRLLLELGYEVHVACNFIEGNTCSDRQILKLQKTLDELQVVRHQWDCPRSVKSITKCAAAYWQLWKLTGKYSYEWIHCHSPVGGALARLAARQKGIRVIYTAHGFHFYRGAPLWNWLLYYPVEKLLARWTDVLVTVNKEDDWLAKKKFKAGRTYRISGVGIAIDKFSHSHIQAGSFRKEFCRKYSIPESAQILLSVGELIKRKNHRVVMDAMAGITDQDAYYVICGQGRLQKQLMNYAQKKGVAGRIRMTGFLEDVSSVYLCADIFVFPSYQEGLPVALMEAMAAGLPCVVSDIRGNRELIADPAGGIRFRPKNVRQLQRALKAMLSSSQLRYKCGRYNQLCVRKYAAHIVEKQTRQIYADMIGHACKTEAMQAEQEQADIKKINRNGKAGTAKVLHVLRSSRFSGAENVAATICTNLNSGYRCVYASPMGSIAEYLRKDGIIYEPMTAFCVRELKRIIDTYQPDIIHAHDYTAAVLCSILKQNSFLIVHLHNNPPWIHQWTAKSCLFGMAEHRMDQLLFVSGCIKDEAVFLKKCSVPYRIIGNPLDAERILKKAQEQVEDTYDLVFAGRMTRQKNPEKFIRIVSQLHRMGRPVRAVMLGEGELEAKCRKLILQLGMAGSIVMKGFCENPYPYMRQAKVQLMTSRWEGFGLAALEALLLGTPVLASPVGGLCDIFKSYPQALCASEEEFVKKAARLLRDQRLCQRFCSEAEKKVPVGDLEMYMQKIRSIYGQAACHIKKR